MAMLSKGYNRLSPVYDQLAALVFGGKIRAAQRQLLRYMPPGVRLLIAGGGNGRVLEDMAAIRVPAGAIVYVEAAEKMIARARQRQPAGMPVTYYCGDLLTYTAGSFDAILAPFFFSQFTVPQAVKMAGHLRARLKPGGLLLFTDFYPPGRIADKLLMPVMMLFFRVMLGIRHWRFPPYDEIFLDAGFEQVKDGMIGKSNIGIRVFRAR